MLLTLQFPQESIKIRLSNAVVKCVGYTLYSLASKECQGSEFYYIDTREVRVIRRAGPKEPLVFDSAPPLNGNN